MARDRGKRKKGGPARVASGAAGDGRGTPASPNAPASAKTVPSPTAPARGTSPSEPTSPVASASPATLPASPAAAPPASGAASPSCRATSPSSAVSSPKSAAVASVAASAAASSPAPRGFLARHSAREIVYFVCAVAWVARLSFLSVPVPISYDEEMAQVAGGHVTASRFVETTNWAERWQMANYWSAGGRLYWSLAQMLWGTVFPTVGQSAFALSVVVGILLTFVLARAAHRVFGERGMLLVVFLTAISPYFGNYAVRALGTIHSAAFLALAIFFFAGSGWRIASWAAGGLAFGFAFGTHYGTGPAIVAISAGLLAGTLRGGTRPGLSAWERAKRLLVGPAVGAACSTLPLVVLEIWARYSGDSYLSRLFQHENLLKIEQLGPYGLWVRYVFELDPLLQTLLFAATILGLRSPRVPLAGKILAGATLAVCVALTANSLADATPRAFVSLGLFALAGIAIGGFGIVAMPRLAAPAPEEADAETRAGTGPLDEVAILVATFAGIAFLVWRREFGLPRLAFTLWPLFALSLTGLALRAFGEAWRGWVRLAAVPGVIVCLLASWAIYEAKAVAARASAYAYRHPTKLQLQFADFMEGPAYPKLARRTDDDFKRFGSNWRIYPASAYEEEYFKLLKIGKDLREHGYDRFFEAEGLVYARVFFDWHGDEPGKLPPYGTPLAPEGTRLILPDGSEVAPDVHPYRGVDVRIPGGRHKGPVESRLLFDLPISEPDANTLGFLYSGYQANLPRGTTFAVEVRHQGELIASFVPAIDENEKTPQMVKASVPIRPPGAGREGGERFRGEIVFRLTPPEVPPTPFPTPAPVKPTPVWVGKLKDAIATAPIDYYAPTSLFVQRPFLVAIAPIPGTAGFGEEQPSDARAENYPCFLSTRAPLFYTRLANYAEGLGVQWNSAPWEGPAKNPIVFVGSHEHEPVCEFWVNNELALEYSPAADRDGSWEGPGIRLDFHVMGMGAGYHGLYFLSLDSTRADAGNPVSLRVKVKGGATREAWWGVRDMPNAIDFLADDFQIPKAFAP